MIKMPSISTLFGATAQTSGPAVNPGVNPASINPAAQSPATQSATVANNSTAPNGVVPQTTADSVAAQAEKQGLEKFNDLWDLPAGSNDQGQPLFNISQEQVMEAARKQSFTGQAATAEQLAAVAAGGEGAVQAMLEIMNSVGQHVYAQSAIATTKLIENGLAKGAYAKVSDVEKRIKTNSLNSGLAEVNPMFNNPAAAPLINGLKDQFIQKFPKASPKELQGMVSEYLTSLGAGFAPPTADSSQQKAAKQTEDWGKFFSA